MKTNRRNIALAGIGIAFLPVSILSAGIALSRWPWNWATPTSDYVFLVLCLVPGIVLIARFPTAVLVRFAALVVYLPLSYTILVRYSILFVGIWFNRWP
jgi:hypothetical protein